jgi:hypothetical protein
MSTTDLAAFCHRKNQKLFSKLFPEALKNRFQVLSEKARNFEFLITNLMTLTYGDILHCEIDYLIQ